MNHYTYTALLPADNLYTKGQIKARSQKNAVNKLEKDGLLIINIKKDCQNYWRKFVNYSTISRLEKIHFTRHLHAFLDAGIALDQSIKIAFEQMANKKFKAILSDVHDKVIKGQSLSYALESYSQHFPKYFIKLIRIGEESGALDNVLKHLLDQQEKEYELLKKVQAALVYPLIIVIAAILIVAFIMAFVIPTISGILIEYGGTLPLSTRIIIAISNFFVSYSLAILFTSVALIYSLIKFAKTNQGRRFFERLLFNVPYIRKIYIEYNIARFTRSMNTPLLSGLSIDRALELAAETTNNSHYHASYLKGIKVVRKGVPLSEILTGYPELYPPNVTRMTEIGEKTGKLDQMFSKLADFYEKSVFNTFNNLSSIVEPVLILMIGLVVGFIAISVLMPIWRFTDII